MKRSRFLIILLIIIISVIVLRLLYLSKLTLKTHRASISGNLLNGDYYTQNGNSWEKFNPLQVNDGAEFIAFAPEQLGGRDRYIFQHLIRGYYVNYDNNQEILIIRSPLLNAPVYRDIRIFLPPTQIIYCWPNTIGETVVKDLFFDLENPPVITLPNEQPVVLSGILTQLEENSFFIIQLADAINADRINYTTKTAIICD